MKKLITAATLVMGAAMVSQRVQAQFVPNDLYLGFENAAGGGTADYIINLGAASGLIGAGATTDLSGDFSLSLFNSSLLQGSNPSGIMGGVVGGSNGGSPSDVFLTQSRAGGPGLASVAGSTAPGNLTRSQDNVAYASLTPLVVPSVGTGLLDSSRSWESDVEPTFTAGSFFGNTGANPDSPVSTSTVLYEDLWENSNNTLIGNQPFSYEGYFTLNLTGISPSLTFTPAPEPSTYMLSGVGGILLLLLRSRSWRKTA